jgi:hypothetical protein
MVFSWSLNERLHSDLVVTWLSPGCHLVACLLSKKDDNRKDVQEDNDNCYYPETDQRRTAKEILHVNNFLLVLRVLRGTWWTGVA